MRLVAVATLASLALACGEDFDPAYRLTTPRVLAIRSEPASPTSGETAALSPLVYTPPGDDVAEYQWSWCPFAGPASQGYPCLITEEDLAALGPAAGSVPAFDLGNAETASLPHTLDPDLLATVCAGTPGQPALVDCTGGFPVQIKLTVRAGDAEIAVVRDLRLRFAADHEPNANPVIDGLVAVLEDDEQMISPADGPTLIRREETPIRAQVAPEVSETFTAIDDDGNPAPERERLIVSWFVESGDVDEERTSYIDGVVDLDDALANVWEPDGEDDYPRETSELIVVVRDSRGGVSWVSGAVSLATGAP